MVEKKKKTKAAIPVNNHSTNFLPILNEMINYKYESIYKKIPYNQKKKLLTSFTN